MSQIWVHGAGQGDVSRRGRVCSCPWELRQDGRLDLAAIAVVMIWVHGGTCGRSFWHNRVKVVSKLGTGMPWGMSQVSTKLDTTLPYQQPLTGPMMGRSDVTSHHWAKK